eukprot:scaffold2311_cov313-Pavlova_lutheri.AAC.1
MRRRGQSLKKPTLQRWPQDQPIEDRAFHPKHIIHPKPALPTLLQKTTPVSSKSPSKHSAYHSCTILGCTTRLVHAAFTEASIEPNHRKHTDDAVQREQRKVSLKRWCTMFDTSWLGKVAGTTMHVRADVGAASTAHRPAQTRCGAAGAIPWRRDRTGR